MQPGHRTAIAIAIVLTLVLAWPVLDGLGVVNPIRDTLTGLVSPLQLVFTRASAPVEHVLGAMRSSAHLAQENEDLREELSALRSQCILRDEALIENEDLRRLLDFKSAVPNYQLIAAEVIGRDPSSYLRYLVIDRGAEDGIRVGMPVLTDAGLVGRISRVSQSASQVMLLSDTKSSVSAYIQRSRATGVVQGELDVELRMRYIVQNETVIVGDVVLTSGLGGSFPRRLVIGQVVEIQQNDMDVHQEALVMPAVDASRLETVLVLLNYEPDEFPAD